MKNFTRSLLLMLSAICLLPSELSALTRPDDFNDRYDLREMVVLSRHSIRAPLSGNGSALADLTSHKWTDWSAAPSELTSRGGALETIMGQYFRKYLAQQGLFPENYVPSTDDVNIYANSMQRTIATAQYFTSGFMPMANLRVNHRFDQSKMDPVFNPRLTKVNPAFKAKAMEQIESMGGKDGIRGINKNLEGSYALIAEVLDLKDSPAAKDKGMTAFDNYDTQISLNLGEEPGMKGSLKDANSASDAFILQYYEEPDSVKAAFGHKLSREQWADIAKIKDVYGDVLFT
ncbi:MAG: histidine-type phosphatase, partial [Muribaculaceae bacterium]|nr:histidine-type phosphatase [Muribaculaceae bacterium]